MKNCILKHTDVNASIYPNLRLECGSVLLEDFTILEHDESSSMNANTLLFPLSDTWFHDSRLHATCSFPARQSQIIHTFYCDYSEGITCMFIIVSRGGLRCYRSWQRE